jgi:uncharacterized membrane protein
MRQLTLWQSNLPRSFRDRSFGVYSTQWFGNLQEHQWISAYEHSLGGDHGHDANTQSRQYCECDGHPMHPMLITLPIGFFVATFLFDLIFWQTGTEAFATGALWLLVAGLIGATLAAVTGLIDVFGDRRTSAVVPLGLVLSLIGVCIMLFTGWKGGEMVFRHRVAVYDEPRW